MVTVNPKTFIQEYFEAISGKPKTMELINKYVSDEHLAGHIMEYENSFPCYELIAEDLICEGDKVAVRARVKAEHKGQLMGYPPTGKTIDIPLSVIYQIEDDKIAKGWIFVDHMELMTQLGIISLN
jgi:predicted ester cyclase